MHTPSIFLLGLVAVAILWSSHQRGAAAQLFDDLSYENQNGRPRAPTPIDNDEANLQNLDYYSPPNYEFEYQVHGGGNVLGHQESRQEAKISGRYFVDLPNGMRQTVVYTADEYGFRPVISYEPITDGGSPPPAAEVVAPTTRNDNYRAFIAEKIAPEPIIPQQNLEEYGLTPPNLKRKRRKQRKVVVVRDQRYSEFPEFGLRIRRRSAKRQIDKRQ